MDWHTILLIIHLFGTAIGAGATFVADFLFFESINDKKVSADEGRLISKVSEAAWIGIAILVISGAILLYSSDFALLSSSAFQVKMTLVAILIINGAIFHFYHLPFLTKEFKTTAMSQNSFTRATQMSISGAVSMLTWPFVIVLGSLRQLDASYLMIMAVYSFGLIIAISLALLVRKKLFHARAINLAKSEKNRKSASTLHKGWQVFIVAGILLAILLAASPYLNRSDQFAATDSIIPHLVDKADLEMVDESEINVAYAPDVPPSANRNEQRMFEVRIEVLENVCDLDSSEETTNFDVWGYRIEGDTEINCGAPGPVIRGRVGDVARISLINLPENKHPHNIDFHAATGIGGGAKDLTVAPGEEASIEVRLLYPGVFMYHCAYGDVPEHIVHGMYGQFIVDPEVSLPSVDHEFSISQSEWYLGDRDENGLVDMDRDALEDEEPSLITFNGSVGALTGDNALKMKVGERARIYFVNQGLNLNSNFHPIGSHWDTVYLEGATHPSNKVIRGSQSTLVVAGGGSVVEIEAHLPGTIVLVDHALTRAFYKGAVGHINVTGPENPELFEVVKPSAGGAKDHSHSGDQEVDEEHGDSGEPLKMSQQAVAVSITKNSAARINLHQSYLPKVLRIKAGTTVTWTNDDNVMHTVTSGNGDTETPDGIIESGYMKKGDTFSYTFNDVGTFPYYCIPHPLMQGTIIVEPA